jgi:glycosyltransferase involved in cell wall biosynthesis
VTNDLVTDQRVQRVISVLQRSGHKIVFVGRKMRDSLPFHPKGFLAKRFRLLFHRKFLFYAEFNVRLFFYLLFRKVHILVANDLDTLPAMFLAARLKGIPLVYDSHEYFTGSFELENRRFIKSVWEKIEKWILPKLKHVLTVNHSIARLYQTKYGIDVAVVRNFAPFRVPAVEQSELPEKVRDRQFFILQGSGINPGRGAEEAVLAMKLVEDSVLLIVGRGMALPDIRNLIVREKLEGKVILLEPVPYEKLIKITSKAVAGLSLDKPLSLNYKYSLPNKISDYIQARIPLIVSNLQEVASIVKSYDIGMVCDNVEAEDIAACMQSVLSDASLRTKWKVNLDVAASEVCWEREEERLIAFYAGLGLEFPNN